MRGGGARLVASTSEEAAMPGPVRVEVQRHDVVQADPTAA